MLNIFERIIMLKQGQVFSQVGTDNLRVIAGELIVEECLKGERVFDINEFGDQMYIIEKGEIGISIEQNPENKVFIAKLGVGECFGEMGLLDDLPRSASAHVLEDSTLLVLEKSRLIGLINRYPELALGILRSLSLRLRESHAKLAELRD